MDDLTIIMCICIGNAVAWLTALYTPSGLYLLIWNVVFAMLGATLCALAIAWIAFPLGGVWLLVAGPPSALFMIFAGHALRRALQKRLA